MTLRNVTSASSSARLLEPARIETSPPTAPPEAPVRAPGPLLSHDQASEPRARDWVARKTERLENFEKGRRPSGVGSRKRSARGGVDANDAASAYESLGSLEDAAFSAPRLGDTEAWAAIRVAHQHAAEFEEHARDAWPGPDGTPLRAVRASIVLDR